MASMSGGRRGSPDHPAATAREGKPIVVNHRTSAFVETDLATLLRANCLVPHAAAQFEIVRRTGKSKTSVWCWQERFDDAKDRRNCVSRERR